MVANTPNGRTPHIGGGIALLPLTEGSKQGADDLFGQGWNWHDIQAFIYPLHEVFDNTGAFSPAPRLSSSAASNPVCENDDDRKVLPIISLKDFLEQTPEPYEWVVEGLLAKGNITILAGAPEEQVWIRRRARGICRRFRITATATFAGTAATEVPTTPASIPSVAVTLLTSSLIKIIVLPMKH